VPRRARLGLSDGATYACEVSATNTAGTGTSSDGYTVGPIEFTGVKLELDLAVGDVFAGTTTRIQGGGLAANSSYTLVQHSDPVTLYTGTADADGNFDESFVTTAEACVLGAHELVLTGTAPDNSTITDTTWYEIGAGCAVLQASDAGPVTPGEPDADDEDSAPATLARTGGTVSVEALGFGGGALLVGVALLLAVRRRARQDESAAR
jgi:hypothetical protein